MTKSQLKTGDAAVAALRNNTQYETKGKIAHKRAPYFVDKRKHKPQSSTQEQMNII